MLCSEWVPSEWVQTADKYITIIHCSPCSKHQKSFMKSWIPEKSVPEKTNILSSFTYHVVKPQSAPKAIPNLPWNTKKYILRILVAKQFCSPLTSAEFLSMQCQWELKWESMGTERFLFTNILNISSFVFRGGGGGGHIVKQVCMANCIYKSTSLTQTIVDPKFSTILNLNLKERRKREGKT